MNVRMITGIILVLTTFVWFVWDIYAFASGQKGATISEVITDFYYYSPAAALLAGVLIDHWFLPEFKPDRLLKRGKDASS